jgi:hypothetical protein
LPKYKQLIFTLGDLQLKTFYSGERFEGRARGTPAFRAVTVECVAKSILDRVFDVAAETFTNEI